MKYVFEDHLRLETQVRRLKSGDPRLDPIPQIGDWRPGQEAGTGGWDRRRPGPEEAGTGGGWDRRRLGPEAGTGGWSK